MIVLADLRAIEKNYIEDFLQMESGYVLDFSNRTLERFVFDSINIEIYKGKSYEEYCSKANKIRQILKQEPNSKVAQLLEDLVEYKSYKAEQSGKELSEADKKLKQEINKIIQRLKSKEHSMTRVSSISSNKDYDVFISHASEDKQTFVEPLTKALQDAGIKTWYDADEIGWGESIRQSIDRGLSNSRFCIVVLSSDFFKKYWAGTYELTAIFQRAALEQNSLILPIWHSITLKEISQHNLILSDIKALDSSIHTLEQIVDEMKSKLK